MINPAERLSSFDALKKHPYIEDVDFEQVIKCETKPGFVPAVSITTHLLPIKHYEICFYSCGPSNQTGLRYDVFPVPPNKTNLIYLYFLHIL